MHRLKYNITLIIDVGNLLVTSLELIRFYLRESHKRFYLEATSMLSKVCDLEHKIGEDKRTIESRNRNRPDGTTPSGPLFQVSRHFLLNILIFIGAEKGLMTRSFKQEVRSSILRELRMQG